MKTYRLPKYGHLHRALEEPKGRRCDHRVLLDQIGRGAVLRVSGGRHQRVVVYRENPATKEGFSETVGVFLPMTKYDGVRVLYNFLDLYDVQRVKLHRDGSVTVLREWRDVGCETVGEIVLDAEGHDPRADATRDDET